MADLQLILANPLSDSNVLASPVVLAISTLSNSNVLASPVISYMDGYNYCIRFCTKEFFEVECQAECRKRNYSLGWCLGAAPHFQCCCKK
ncbi:unnamed protein product [Eruca vesicaria subsp. sativa]|uniref:Defensin-like domain-containing protein n=1 Tax=Eruca vesicaria subsp. sativa TaxID=29727 RepID=A0ABC8KNI7_ERUVS|nr:unnamed protein product [Eruca vesicaria subsp. sativa]